MKRNKQVVIYGIGAIAAKAMTRVLQDMEWVQGRAVEDLATQPALIAEACGRGISCAVFVGSLGGGDTGERLLEWVTAFHNARIPSIAIVSTPFRFEGAIFCKRASLLLEEIRLKCGSTFVIESESILIASGKHITMEEAMKRLGIKLGEDASLIVEAITTSDDLRIGYSSLTAPVRNGGMSYLRRSDMYDGNTAISRAIDEALNRSIMALRSETSTRYYLRLVTGPNISNSDVTEAYRLVCRRWHLDPHCLALGWRIDRDFGDQVQGTAIAMEGGVQPKQYAPVAFPLSESAVTLTLHLIEDNALPESKPMGVSKGGKTALIKTGKSHRPLHHTVIGA